MKIKTLVVELDGKEYSFTSRSVIEVKPYNPTTDPEVQGVGLADLDKEPQVEPLKTKKKKK